MAARTLRFPIERARGRSEAGDALMHVVVGLMLVGVLGLGLADPLYARDLGAIGPVHPITEPDMLKEIEAVLREKQASGELARIQAEAQRRIEARIVTPRPVEGMRRAQVPRSYPFDPSVRFDEAVVDERGRMVVPAGMLANPLAVVTLQSSLFFFDGRDAQQVALAKAEVEQHGMSVKPILVAGSPIELARLWKRAVFFDQDGRMVKRFGIEAVPARVSQQGLALLVQEIPPK